MTRNFTRLFFCLLLPLTGCAVHIPDASPYTNLEVPAATAAEAQLLDVAIGQFTFKPPMKDGAPDVQQTDIRKAESRYMPVMLRHTLTQTEGWGGIYVLPEAGRGHDVRVEGEILQSESHTLQLRVSVLDATGAEWFERIYTEHVGLEVHGEHSIGVNDPFAGIYNRIANDMLVYARDNLDATELATIRQTAELQFGNEFAPDVYGGYLATDRKGISTVVRMPPPSDPAVVHLEQIRQRDRAFQEVLQQHYVDFVRSISDSYFSFRRQSFNELLDLRQQQREARNDMVVGGILIGVAVATHNVDDVLASAASATAAVAGATKIVTGVRNYTTEQPFAGELAESFAGNVVTEVVSLDEEVVTLSGSTESIYDQWKDILRELFKEDRSQSVVPTE